MESIKQSLFIDFSALEIRIPAVGERVYLAGERGEFMVVRIDRKRHVADVIRTTGLRRIESGVPLFALRPIESRRINDDASYSDFSTSTYQAQE